MIVLIFQPILQYKTLVVYAFQKHGYVQSYSG